MGSTLAFDALPWWGWALVVVLWVAQLALEIWALVDMLRRPESELALGAGSGCGRSSSCS